MSIVSGGCDCANAATPKHKLRTLANATDLAKPWQQSFVLIDIEELSYQSETAVTCWPRIGVHATTARSRSGARDGSQSRRQHALHRGSARLQRPLGETATRITVDGIEAT